MLSYTILLLLDLSAAFDTVDHNILTECLKNRVCISGLILDWLGCYRSER